MSHVISSPLLPKSSLTIPLSSSLYLLSSCSNFLKASSFYVRNDLSLYLSSFLKSLYFLLPTSLFSFECSLSLSVQVSKVQLTNATDIVILLKSLWVSLYLLGVHSMPPKAKSIILFETSLYYRKVYFLAQ